MISYYDIRAARTAMRALQNKPLRRRKLDIHFSIPKVQNKLSGSCSFVVDVDTLFMTFLLSFLSFLFPFLAPFQDNPSDKDINPGTLVVFNLDPSVSNDDLLQIFGAYGEVKEVTIDSILFFIYC